MMKKCTHTLIQTLSAFMIAACFGGLALAEAPADRANKNAMEHVKAIERVTKWEPLDEFPDEFQNQMCIKLDGPVRTADELAKVLEAIPKKFLNGWVLGQTVQVGEWWVTPVGKGPTPGQMPWIHVFAVKKGGKLLYKNSQW